MVVNIIVYFVAHVAMLSNGQLVGITPEEIFDQQMKQVAQIAESNLIEAESKIKEMNETVSQLESQLDTSANNGRIDFMVKYNDCREVFRDGRNASGVYFIWFPSNYKFLPIYCDMETRGDASGEVGWMVIQNRINGLTNFHRTYDDYVQGFGTPLGEFWIGLENIHMMTNDFEMNKKGKFRSFRIDFEPLSGPPKFLEMTNFQIGNSATNYLLSKLTRGSHHRYLPWWHEGMKFFSQVTNSSNCGLTGGWWFLTCVYDSNPNGDFPDTNTDHDLKDNKYMRIEGVGIIKKVSIKLQ